MAARPRGPSGRRRTTVAVAVLFVVNGAALSSWLPRIPEVRDRLDLDVAELGAVLLCVGLGGLIGSLASAGLIGRLGDRRVAVATSVMLALGLPALGLAERAVALAAALLVLGGLDAIADIAMNAQGVRLQAQCGRSVLNRLHAAWSIGAVTGAGAGAGAVVIGLPLAWHLAGVSVLCLLAVAWAAPRLLPPDTAARAPGRGRVAVGGLALGVGGAAAAAAVVEGAPGDWSAVLLADVHGARPGVAALGFTAFAAAMLGGRLVADRLVDRRGWTAVGRLGLGLMAAGLVLALADGGPWPALAGFALLGLGAAVLFPMLYWVAGSRPGLGAGVGLAAASAGARVGFLCGPLLVGAIGSALGLRAALGLTIGLGLAGLAVVSVAHRAPR